ncbi:hypothetical protein F7734_50510, partial [Scytonema sp. UIC 10036]|nr:hypothetical protein [Scytonema sp. UIC 10036]
MNDTIGVKTILILTANPASSSRLRLDEEVREISEGLRRANHREQLFLSTTPYKRFLQDKHIYS